MSEDSILSCDDFLSIYKSTRREIQTTFFWAHKFIKASDFKYVKYRWLGWEGNAAWIVDVINMRKTLAGSTKFRISAGTRDFWLLQVAEPGYEVGDGGSPLKIQNVTISLKHTYCYLALRIRMNGAVPPPFLMPLRLAKGTLQISCERVEIIVPCAVTRPLWLLYCMSGFAIHRQFLAITRWTILPCNLPTSQQPTRSTPTLYKTLQSEQSH